MTVHIRPYVAKASPANTALQLCSIKHMCTITLKHEYNYIIQENKSCGYVIVCDINEPCTYVNRLCNKNVGHVATFYKQLCNQYISIRHVQVTQYLHVITDLYIIKEHW